MKVHKDSNPDSAAPFEDSDPPFDKNSKRTVKSTNVNTLLIMIVIALASWNLKETVQQGRDFSRLEERTAIVTRDMADLRLRMSANEQITFQLQLELARLKRSSP